MRGQFWWSSGDLAEIKCCARRNDRVTIENRNPCMVQQGLRMPEVNHIHVSHVSSPRYAFSGGYICSCMLSAGLTLTVKSLTDHLAFRMSATRFASLRQKWIHPEFQQGNKRLTLREMAEPNVDPEAPPLKKAKQS